MKTQRDLNIKRIIKRRLVIAIGVAVWLGAMLGGLLWSARYTETPGAQQEALPQWPAHTCIKRSLGTPTLVMFAHPHCPCTAASLDELERLMSDCQGRISAHVLFLKPREMTESWTKSPSWNKASAIPGVTVEMDGEGVEAERFHSLTSGYTVVYGIDGRLLFQGGITISRGHSGDNPGRTAIARLAQGAGAEHIRTRVFGCSLGKESCTNKARL